MLAIDDIVAHDDLIHGSTQKATDRLGGRADNRLVFIQRGIKDDGYACFLAKRFDEFPIKRIGFLRHRL